MAGRSPRHEERGNFDVPTRLRLLEGDVDNQDDVVKEINQRLARNNQLLVGILISVTTASLLMLVNVLLLGAK